MNKVPKVVLLLESSREYGREMVRGIARFSRMYGPWTFYREDVFYNPQMFSKKDYSWIKKWGADGIITRDSSNIKELIALGLPIISVRAFQQKLDGIVEVATDNKMIAKMASDHFLSRGFTNFAFCGFKDMHWSLERCDFFKEALKLLGFKPSIFNSSSARMLSWDEEYEHLVKWLVSLEKPVAMLCCNDDRGRDIIEACKTIGIRVPFDVAVLGVDNDRQVCDLANPPLSSISLSTEQSGFEAAAVLGKLIDGQKVGIKEITVMPLQVHSRQSTDTLAIDDPQVVKALQYINLNAKNLIQVSDVLNARGMFQKGA